MADTPEDAAPLTLQEAREAARCLRELGRAFGGDFAERAYQLAAELDPSLHTWDGPKPEAIRDEHGQLIADPDAHLGATAET